MFSFWSYGSWLIFFVLGSFPNTRSLSSLMVNVCIYIIGNDVCPCYQKYIGQFFFLVFWVFSVPFPFSRSLSHSLAQYNFRLKCMCLCMLRKIHFPSKSASLFSISVHFLKLRQWTQQIDRTINNNGLVSLQHKFIRLLFLFSFYFSIFPFNQIWHC